MNARLASAAAASTLLLTGCFFTPPRLPAPAAGMRRDAIEPRGERCRMGTCISGVAVGGRHFRVESRARLVSPEEATGRPKRSLVRRALSAVGGAVLREAGVGTSALVVGVGTRAVSDSAGTLTLACDIVWIDEEAREKAHGEDSVTSTRLAEGIACTAASAAKPGEPATAQWRFRRGISPSRDSLALVLDSTSLHSATGMPAELAMTLERVASADAPATLRYSIEPDTTLQRSSGPIVIPMTRWIVRRADGAVVGALVRSALSGAAVDIGSDAAHEEATILRLIGACLVPPFAAT